MAAAALSQVGVVVAARPPIRHPPPGHEDGRGELYYSFVEQPRQQLCRRRTSQNLALTRL